MEFAAPGQRPPRMAGAPTASGRAAARRRKPPVPRLTSEAYFYAAYELLADLGAEGVTVTNMCDRLTVTTGSFYYHFYNMAEFVEAFAAYWESTLTALMGAAVQVEDPLRRMAFVATAIANLSHEAEASLRAWGHSNPVIRDAQLRIDRAAEQMAEAMLEPYVSDPETVALHAHHFVALAIGLQHRERPIDRERYLRTIVWLAEAVAPVQGSIVCRDTGPTVEFTFVGDRS